MTVKSRLFGAAVGAIATLALAGGAIADEYPSRTITMIVAYPAGQGTDLAARYYAEKLSDALGQSVVVDNRPGAGGNVGTASASREEADGYTILMGASGTHAMNPSMFKDPGYDAADDFDPVAATIVIPMAISAHPSIGVSSIPELMEYAQANPGAVDVALPSVTAQLVLELLKDEGAPLNGINYGGSAEATAAVLGNQVPVLIDTLGASRRHFERLTPIAVTSPSAASSLPELASVAEQGIDGFSVTAWNVLYVLSDTPDEIRERLRDEMRTILNDPATADGMRDLGFELSPWMEREELEAWEQGERDRYGEVIRAAGLDGR
ncbi:Bug family tripartite tricarboxylate transporter substrate binding protein [Billgrantia sp. Q4P2]|uniref:Bug family tripartite tricarboxylate transporter substrate binding protein n=1 Tax=Billgrantia sp. Q4P2 TaxID=3463857 RepID=UPI004055B012